MPHDPSHRYSSPDIRNRIRALLGDPLPEEVVAEGMKEFGRRLVARHEARRAHHAQEAAARSKIRGAMVRLIAEDKEARDGLQTLKEIREHRKAPKQTVPTHPKVEPQIRPGSLVTVVAPPYDYQWIDYSKYDYDDNSSGSGFASAQDGHFGTSATSNGKGAWGSAALGIYLGPLPDTRSITFSGYVKYSYYWLDDSYGETAHNDGNLGVIVTSWDASGQDPRTDYDQRPALWSDGTAYWDPPHTDDEPGLVIAPAFSFNVEGGRQYALWIMANSSCDASGGTVDGSHSENWVAGIVPFMVVQQSDVLIQSLP